MPLVTIKRFILPAFLFAMSSAMIWAGCKSDCRDDYESEVESCRLIYDTPDDADELQMCIQNAKDNTNPASKNATTNLPLYFALICEGELTTISGLPLFKMIFPETATVRPLYCCGRENCAALAAWIKTANA